MRRALKLAVLIAGCLVAASLAIPAFPAAAANPPTCFSKPATIFGTSRTIIGTAGNDVIVGSPGNDTIFAGGGDDLVCGGGGNDLLFGGDGTDYLAGQAGADQMFGGEGNDYLSGESDSFFPVCSDGGAADRLDGGEGNDLIIDQCGANRANGGDGQDNGIVTGTFNGGEDDDNLQVIPLRSAQFPGDLVAISIFPPITAHESCPGCNDGQALGGPGNDTVGVNGGVADGGPGNDLVIGFGDGDAAFGGPGADRVSDGSAAGRLLLDGGPGPDTCQLGGHTNDTVHSCEVVQP